MLLLAVEAILCLSDVSHHGRRRFQFGTPEKGSALVNPVKDEAPQKPKEGEVEKEAASKTQHEEKELRTKCKSSITKWGTGPPSEVKRARSAGRPGMKSEPSLTVKAKSMSEFPFLEGKQKAMMGETKEIPLRKRLMATQPHCPPKKTPMSSTSVPKEELKNPKKSLPESSASGSKKTAGSARQAWKGLECSRTFRTILEASRGPERPIYTVSALTFISGNGPPLSHFDARIYVVSCMKAGRHSAMEKPTGKQKKPIVIKAKQKLLSK